MMLLGMMVAMVAAHLYVSCGPGGTAGESAQETVSQQEGQKESVDQEGNAGTEPGTEPANEGGLQEKPSGVDDNPGGPEGGREPLGENPTTTDTSDGGNTPGPETPGQELPPTEQSTSGITVTWNPASGSTIDVQDFCIDLTFSKAVNKTKWEATWNIKGASGLNTLVLNFSSDTNAKVCFDEYLAQNTTYEIHVTAYDANGGSQVKASATYTTKAPFTSGSPAKAGLTVDLQLKKVLVPSALNALISTVSPDQILPILMHLHSRDTGTSGSLTLVGGVGVALSGKPHQGNDVFDNTREPVSISMKGEYNGRLFTAGPSTFRLSVANFKLVLEQFRLSGVFNAAGDNFEDVRFSGIVETNDLKASLGLDPCLLLAGVCFNDSKGRTLIFMVGQMNAILNPVKFSVLLTDPPYLTQQVVATPILQFYATEAMDDKNVTLSFSSCSNSGSIDKPCDPASGAVLQNVTVNGTLTIDAAKKSGTYTVTSGLSVQTWYKVEITAKDTTGTTYKTFTVFRTN